LGDWDCFGLKGRPRNDIFYWIPAPQSGRGKPPKKAGRGRLRRSDIDLWWWGKIEKEPLAVQGANKAGHKPYLLRITLCPRAGCPCHKNMTPATGAGANQVAGITIKVHSLICCNPVCDTIAGIHNQVWSCRECNCSKGTKGLYEFFRDKFANERKYYDMIPPLLEKKYLKTIYNCHKCAETIDKGDLDGDGKITVLDIDHILH
jgi:ribosomal protein L37AE/L43A